jgi:hypothetical protein
MPRDPKCQWCGEVVGGDARVIDGGVLHASCVARRDAVMVDSVTTLPTSSFTYVFVEAAVIGLASDAHGNPRTFAGFIARFKRRRGNPTDRMTEMLREAYIAGAVDGAQAMSYALRKS